MGLQTHNGGICFGFCNCSVFAVPVTATMVLVGGRLLYISVKAENADWVCPKCGNEDNIRRSRYCPECGSEMVAVLRQMRRCPNGHKVSEFDKYCPKCGAKIDGS